ncbi:MAG TPA: tetratricopeptide repeat protein [Terriglobales bacterium]
MKTTAAVLLFSSCLLFGQTPPAPAPPQSAVPPQIKQAQELNNEGKQAEALAILNQMLASDPKNYQANLNAGIVLDLMGEYSKARTHLDMAVEVAPADRRVQALRTTAVSYAFQCDLPQVTKYEQQAFDAQIKDQKFTDAAGTANELARIDLECGDIPAASKWYQTGYDTTLRAPNLSDADRDLWEFRLQNAKARVAAREGKPSEASAEEASAKATLDKGKIPDQQRFYPYLAGYVAFYAGDYKTAIDQLLKADQKDPFILVLLAQTYEKSGNQAEATKYYKEVLTNNSHNPTNAFARPLAQKKLGVVSG